MKSGVTPKLESKWWKDNKDLLVPEDPLGKALKRYEAAKTAMTKDQCLNTFQEAVFLVREVAESAKTQVGKCTKLLHKDTIAALGKYKDVVKDEQEDIEGKRDQYNSTITQEFDKFRLPAQATLKRLVELDEAVKARMKGAKKAVENGKGREFQTELASDLKELATRFTACNVVSNDLEKLANKRDFGQVCTNPLRDLRKELETGRNRGRKTLELLRDLVDNLSQDQGDKESKQRQQALDTFKENVDRLAKQVTNTNLDAMLGLGDFGQIKVDKDDTLDKVRQARQKYAQFEQLLTTYIKTATDIQHPVALFLKKSEEGQKSVKKLKEVLAKDAVELKKRCISVGKDLDKLEEQRTNYADWDERSLKVEEDVAKQETEVEHYVNLAKKKLAPNDVEAVYNKLIKYASIAGNSQELKLLQQAVKGKLYDMPLTSQTLDKRLTGLQRRLDAIVKTITTQMELLESKMPKVTFGGKTKV